MNTQLRPGSVTWVEADGDAYAVVLADLEAQRARIDTAIAAIKALRPAPASDDSAMTGPPPPRPKRQIPTDPEALKAEAIALLDAGLGMEEVKRELELSDEQAQAFFFGK